MTEYTIEEMIHNSKALQAALEEKIRHSVAPVVVQTTSRPYGIMETIPAGAWHAYGQATTVNGLIRVYRRAYCDTHPQQNAWCGHVRLTINGQRISTTQALKHFRDLFPNHNAFILSNEGKLPRD